jgi:far upstream element-binding protein
MAQNNDLAEAIRKAREMAAKMTPGIVAAAAAQQQANGNGDMNSRKRPHDEDDGPQVKKLSMEDPQAVAQAAIAKVGAQLGLPHMMTVEIKIPNRMVGLVIGRGGEMITRLQAESGARIQVAPDGSEVSGERQVTICGTQDTIDKAKALIGKVVEDAGGQLTNIPLGSALSGMSGGMSGGGMSMSGMAGMAGMMGGEEVAELMIPANKVGLIIGKGGEMIKALQVYIPTGVKLNSNATLHHSRFYTTLLQYSLTHTSIRSPSFEGLRVWCPTFIRRSAPLPCGFLTDVSHSCG